MSRAAPRHDRMSASLSPAGVDADRAGDAFGGHRRRGLLGRLLEKAFGRAG